IVVALLIYWILTVVKTNVKTLRIFKGTIIVLIINLIARFLNMHVLETLTSNLINWGFLVIIIIFQPEIRTFLEKIGKSSKYHTSLVALDLDNDDIDEITSAVIDLASSKTGALITVERETSLKDFINAGVLMDADISKELIKSVFKTTTPLHDGAVIIQGDRIACASTFYPPATIDVIQSFGSRHRAAIGISEITDSLTIVVSEETGEIRLVANGEATKVSPSDFKEAFIDALTTKESGVDRNEKI
ncbi:MAG: diadenylate cyclase CdaA, partial [Bacilli bacterium]|nr:diadenylate cyclase CdaA [Bacilli bacterium]